MVPHPELWCRHANTLLSSMLFQYLQFRHAVTGQFGFILPVLADNHSADAMVTASPTQVIPAFYAAFQDPMTQHKPYN